MSGFGIGEFCRQYRILYNRINGTNWLLYDGEWVNMIPVEFWTECF